MEIINKIYFSIFIFSIIVFVDLLVKFKRPLILKIYLALITLSAGLNALIFTVDFPSNYFLFTTSLLKGVMSFSIINVFTILYISNFKKWVNLIGIFYLIYEVLLFNFIFKNPNLFNVNEHKALFMLMKTKIEFPLYLNFFRIIITFAFLGAMGYSTTWIIIKQQQHNIYFDKIKVWSKMLALFSVSMTIIFLPLSFFTISELVSYIISFSAFLILLFFVFYRPVFLNRSALKISLGTSFNRDSAYAISELEFINEFYTKLYFIQNDASLENLAKLLHITSNDLYKFIYYKYSMTFNDLVNKNRVDYFIDIIHNPKYLNFTIDALAKEAGFSSRQHLYKPFKKFHGGNPSDIMDALEV
jgi:AraC-like DNA-binding protein